MAKLRVFLNGTKVGFFPSCFLLIYLSGPLCFSLIPGLFAFCLEVGLGAAGFCWVFLVQSQPGFRTKAGGLLHSQFNVKTIPDFLPTEL